jgi:8-oxo-dGTP pyrophosphatase MutT (NUDIX family)
MEARIAMLFSSVTTEAKEVSRIQPRRTTRLARLKAGLASSLKAGVQKTVPVVFNKIGRPIFQQFWRWRRGLTLGVRAIVLDRDGRVLLVRQTYTKGWILPGGGVELGETLEQSLARELDEEAGVVLEGPPELMGIYDNRAIFPGDHVAIYVVRYWSRNRVPRANMEIVESEFFAVDALPESIAPGARRRIEEMLGQRAFETHW